MASGNKIINIILQCRFNRWTHLLENSQEFAQSLTNQVFQGSRIYAHEVLIKFLTINHTFLSTNYILWACSMDSGPWPSSKSSLGSLSFFSRLSLRVKYCTDFWFGSFTIQVLLTFPLNWSFDEEGPVSGPSGPALLYVQLACPISAIHTCSNFITMYCIKWKKGMVYSVTHQRSTLVGQTCFFCQRACKVNFFARWAWIEIPPGMFRKRC